MLLLTCCGHYRLRLHLWGPWVSSRVISCVPPIFNFWLLNPGAFSGGGEAPGTSSYPPLQLHLRSGACYSAMFVCNDDLSILASSSRRQFLPPLYEEHVLSPAGPHHYVLGGTLCKGSCVAPTFSDESNAMDYLCLCPVFVPQAPQPICSGHCPIDSCDVLRRATLCRCRLAVIS